MPRHPNEHCVAHPGGKDLLPTRCCGLSWGFFTVCVDMEQRIPVKHPTGSLSGRMEKGCMGHQPPVPVFDHPYGTKCFLMSNLSLPWLSSVPFLSCHQFPAAESSTSVCLPCSGSCTEPPLLQTRQVQLDETLLDLKFLLLEDSRCS